MNRPFIILTDVDGVLEDLVTPWVYALNKKYDRNVQPTDIVDWDICKFFPGLTKNQVFSPLHKEEFWLELKPYEDAQYYTKKLKDEGHKVIAVTSAHPDTVPYKWAWLNKHFPNFAFRDIVIASHKQMIMGDILIDDGVHNLLGGNYRKFLFTANHNKDFNAEANYIQRVDNWEHIYKLIHDMDTDRLF